MVLELSHAFIYEVILYSTSSPVEHKSMLKLIGLLGVGWAQRINCARFSQTDITPKKRDWDIVDQFFNPKYRLNVLSILSNQKVPGKAKAMLAPSGLKLRKELTLWIFIKFMCWCSLKAGRQQENYDLLWANTTLHPSLRPAGGIQVVPPQLKALSWQAIITFFLLQVCYM